MQDKIEKLNKLVTQFKNNIAVYKSTNYDEANTRVDFIDKFFELLDWDVRNDEDKSEAYRDVVREDKVEIDGKQKAPDYSFRIGGVRKFFVEAKKPSVNIKEDVDPSFQVRRYGYTAKLPLSILTDFEEFAIYDTRIKPVQTDKSSVARVFYCNYEDYEKNFDFIYNTFSKKAIEKGSFDKYIVENKNKKGTTEIDKDFLELIDGWRTDLAKNIALRNSAINIHELNYAVQVIIDRLIFLRIAEDRNIETYGMLQVAAGKPEIYKTLTDIFKKADDKYNSNLFKLNDLIKNLFVDDKILKSIIKTLYYPDCPYEFSILGIEILGNIYEQFLGKTIRLTEGHQAKVEEKPEVRKAGGVYYTPQYIVTYIVQNTIGEKVKDKTPDEIAKLKIVDPACGSGSFLLGAYDFLLKYYLNYWTDDKNIKKGLKDERIYKLHENHYKLTIEEKQKILVNNIYGVDIDSQAVEVTKLSLLLKLLEDENKESSGQLFKHTDFKLLPSLEKNIKCGNSLIGTDFYASNDNKDLFSDESVRKINCFDWEVEFPEVFGKKSVSRGGGETLGKSGVEKESFTRSGGGAEDAKGGERGGFDVVIGNPPYVKYENLDDNLKSYSKNKYLCANGSFDIFQLFLEKSFYIINNAGLLGFIFPNLFLKGMNYKTSRKFFYDNSKIEIIRNYGDGVFLNVQMPTFIFIVRKDKIKNKRVLFYFKKNESFIELEFDQTEFNNENFIYEFNRLSSRLTENKIKLGEIVEVTRGLEIGKDKISADVIGKKIIFGEDISRYLIKHINYIDEKVYQDYKKNDGIFEQEKILIRETGNRLTVTYDKEGLLTNRSLYCIRSKKCNLFFILGILNSKLIQYFYTKQFKSDTDIFPKIRIGQVKEIPIPNSATSATPRDTSHHDQLVSLVDQMLEAQKKFHLANIDTEKRLFKQRIDMLDKQIDKLVYELYGLTEEEVRIVEGGE